MDALELLKTDHETVAELFEQVEKATTAERERLFERIKTALETHTHIEETLFYPALEEHEDLKEMVAEAYEEHREVKGLLQDISESTKVSNNFEAKLKLLRENVEHHVEEEENDMFPTVEETFSESELERLGLEMEDAKKEFGKRYKSTVASRK